MGCGAEETLHEESRLFHRDGIDTLCQGSDGCKRSNY